MSSLPSASSQLSSSRPPSSSQALTSRITQLEDSLSDAHRSSRSKDALISSLEDDLQNARNSRDLYREEKEKIIGERQVLLDELERLRGETERLKSENERPEALVTDRDRLREKMERAKEERDRLQAERDEALRGREALRAENSEVKEELERVRADMTKLKRNGYTSVEGRRDSESVVKGENAQEAEQLRGVVPTSRVGNSSEEGYVGHTVRRTIKVRGQSSFLLYAKSIIVYLPLYPSSLNRQQVPVLSRHTRLPNPWTSKSSS